MRLFYLLLITLASSIFAKQIDTFHGPLDVEEPVLIELIEAPGMQRLKDVHQYGLAYYTTHKEEYNRFDHSIGVFAILRKNGASLHEQIAGLLHDVSHTAFSHVGDWVFKVDSSETDYQSSIHAKHLSESGLAEILNKYDISIETILPDRKEFIMLEQAGPNLCADRIDYNIQGAFYQNFLTLSESIALFNSLYFENGTWIIKDKELAAKLAHFSLFMTEDCWGGYINNASSTWFADAILRGFEIGLFTTREFHHGIDDPIWNQLNESSDPFIQEKMKLIKNAHLYVVSVPIEEADEFLSFKCRGIDPKFTMKAKFTPFQKLMTLTEKAL